MTSKERLFLDWKYISEDQIKELERTLDSQQIKQNLLSIFEFNDLNKEQLSIVGNLFMRTYAFCKSSAFDYRRISTLLSILYEIFHRDITLTTAENDMNKSFTFFETLLLKHSVESPPKSIKVFNPVDVTAIMDFILERYYRHFKVYSYIFTTQVIISLEQADGNDIESPRTQLPLQTAFRIS
eukprot:gene9106-10052_t